MKRFGKISLGVSWLFSFTFVFRALNIFTTLRNEAQTVLSPIYNEFVVQEWVKDKLDHSIHQLENKKTEIEALRKVAAANKWKLRNSWGTSTISTQLLEVEFLLGGTECVSVHDKLLVVVSVPLDNNWGGLIGPPYWVPQWIFSSADTSSLWVELLVQVRGLERRIIVVVVSPGCKMLPS